MMGKALDTGVPLLGICQGAQMLAWHQGAWAGAPDHGMHEFGLYEITPSEEAGDFLTEPMHVTQAHYHTFDLPKGAVRLAGSEHFENQAFRLGDNAYGLQFHPEQTAAGFRRWQKKDFGMRDKPGVQSREEQDALLAQHDGAGPSVPGHRSEAAASPAGATGRTGERVADRTRDVAMVAGQSAGRALPFPCLGQTGEWAIGTSQRVSAPPCHRFPAISIRLQRRPGASSVCIRKP